MKSEANGSCRFFLKNCLDKRKVSFYPKLFLSKLKTTNPLIFHLSSSPGGLSKMGFTRVNIIYVYLEGARCPCPCGGTHGHLPPCPCLCSPPALKVRGRCSLVFVSQEAEHFYFLFYLFPDSWLSLMDCLSACA